MTLLAALTMCCTTAWAQPADVPVQTGQYEPTWENLAAWECPEWFRNAKFGIWAHWDPQCQAEAGDWYARFMYYPGDWKYNWHVEHFGNPGTYGYKELCRDWKAEDWNPEELISLYQSAGARYFMAMGNHHDNFDCWDSPYQEWNSMRVGPMKDIVGGWSEMCKKYGLHLGISFHASHAWTWMEPSQRFDGNLTKADGAGLWWKGLDPQELYAQNHAHSSGWDNSGTIHSQWNWANGANLPSQAYKQKFQNRVLQCINAYHPDVIYFDDTVLPFWGCDESIGLNILTHYYNTSAQRDGTGKAEVVVTGKILQDQHKKAMMWDVERGVPDHCQDLPWQTCTCLGDWHYERGIYERNGYKSADHVIRMLVDIVSKNGNLLLSVPVRGSGVIDERERERVMGIKAWMDINSESIYDTRPWKVYGEGPLFETANPLNEQGFNEGINYSASDVRYVVKEGTVYATIMVWPSAGEFTFKTFSIASPYYNGKVKSVRLLGAGDVPFTFDEYGLTVQVPAKHPNEIAPVFAITFEEAANDFESLQFLIQLIEVKMNVYTAAAGVNTGKYTNYAIDGLKAKLQEARQVTDGDEQLIASALNKLRTAYADFLENGTNQGGALGTTGTDLTTAKLVEASNFATVDASTNRFGTPKNWTVDNFYVPQTNGNSPKNGIDKYSGQACLMLGLWAGEDGNTDSDLANARIYRKVTLEPGRYFFGATYNALYNISKGYIFASKVLTTTDALPEASLAYYPINKGATDGQFYGIEFVVTEEQEVYLGWQADLLHGSNQLEFRVEKVKLVRRSNITMTTLNNLIKKANTALGKTEGCINDNTGYYNAEAVALLQKYVEASNLPEDASDEAIMTAYYTLTAAYNAFLANGQNPPGVLKLASEDDLPEGATDITIEKLMEAENFERATAVDTRFAQPKYWTVENFKIPNGGDGTKNGLDRYSGQDALMLGVWNDRGSNQGGSLTNARIYQQIHLDAGRYYFGARYNANYQLYKAYTFASTDLLTTAKIPTQSIAFDDISTCGMDGLFYGVYFTLNEPQDIYLGFQANLASGSATQEFRAEAVRLLTLPYDKPDGIESPTPDPSREGMGETGAVYDLSGRRLFDSSIVNNHSSIKKGVYIIGGKKVIKK